jgi:hypothetical protein
MKKSGIFNAKFVMEGEISKRPRRIKVIPVNPPLCQVVLDVEVINAECKNKRTY